MEESTYSYIHNQQSIPLPQKTYAYSLKMSEAMPKQEGQPLKFTITHYRLSQHTHEAFIKWVTEEHHLPLALPVLKKHGALSGTL